MIKKCPRCGKEFENASTLCPVDGTVLQKLEDPLIGQTLADKYRIEELINEGGMGAVYRSTHILMDKTVAIKVLHPALAADDKIVARFSREARAASRISHPHALNVTDFGESDNGVVFLVMEYLKGRTLKEVIHDEGPMPLPRVVEIIRQVCGALEAAHEGGVVHRDLKSDNIMLVDVGSNGDWAKVLDFGIAKITEKVGQDPALTAPNLIIGTPQYMSPEQCSQAAEIDSRSDIYSLGVIIYEMFVGHVPFTGESPTAIMMKHLQEPPPAVLEERKDLPAAVGRAVTRAMAKRPEDRFQTVSELSEELASAAETEAPAAAAESASASSAERKTNRIVVTTGSNEAPRDTANEDHDEATVVRARTEAAAAVVAEPEIFSDVIEEPQESFNPWRIVIPAIAGLLVVFVVVFALTRNSSSEPAANDNTQPLTIDETGQPVQPGETPTGEGEQGIRPNATPTAPGGDANTQPGTNANANTGAGTPAGNKNENSEGTEGNENTSEPEDSPTPAKNTNERDEPPPPRSTPTPKPAEDEPPPPPKPKPTLPPPSTNPQPGAGSAPELP